MGRGASMTAKLALASGGASASEVSKIRDIEHYANSYGLTFTGGSQVKNLPH